VSDAGFAAAVSKWTARAAQVALCGTVFSRLSPRGGSPPRKRERLPARCQVGVNHSGELRSGGVAPAWHRRPNADSALSSSAPSISHREALWRRRPRGWPSSGVGRSEPRPRSAQSKPDFAVSDRSRPLVLSLASRQKNTATRTSTEMTDRGVDEGQYGAANAGGEPLGAIGGEPFSAVAECPADPCAGAPEPAQPVIWWQEQGPSARARKAADAVQRRRRRGESSYLRRAEENPCRSKTSTESTPNHQRLPRHDV